MNVYTSDKIRNVVLLGHGGCGKTALVESMAYTVGMINRLRTVAEGGTISDYDKEEVKRQFSIQASTIPIEYDGVKINIIDTPGFFDFSGEVYEALSVADAAVIVISGKSGVEVGTVRAFEFCKKYSIPCMAFITNVDDEHVKVMDIVDDLKSRYGKSIAPFHLPLREDGKFMGFVNVVKMEGRKYLPDGTYEEYEIPEGTEEDLDACREELLEAVAETSEELMDKFFEGEEFTQEEVSHALRTSVHDRSVTPVLIGAPTDSYGAQALLIAINKYFPSPLERISPQFEGENIKSKEAYTASFDDNRPVSAYVFKTIADPFVGKFSLIKVCNGIVKADSTLYNADKSAEEKVGKLYVLQGKDQIEVKELHAGDIGAIAKLAVTKTGDTLSTKVAPIIYNKAEMPKPYTFMRYVTKAKGDEDKVSAALKKLMEEDLTLQEVNDKANRQMLLYGLGEQHLDVVKSKLADRYKVEIDLIKPKVAYKETIRGTVRVQGKHKKQSGGHGQYGDVQMEFAPSGDLDTPYVFEETVFGGAVPKNYFPAVEKGIAESCLKGPLAGYPVVGVKATLLDGSYHPVDSSEMAFKMAAILAFKKGIMDAKPVLLEPIVSLKVNVLDQNTGDVMGDLNKRRGRVLGMTPVDNGRQVIEADIPLANLLGYATDLRSMTGGSGEYSYEFSRYEVCPADVQQKILEEAAKEEN
jgi:elongation factor G